MVKETDVLHLILKMDTLINELIELEGKGEQAIDVANTINGIRVVAEGFGTSDSSDIYLIKGTKLSHIHGGSMKIRSREGQHECLLKYEVDRNIEEENSKELAS